MNKCRPSSNTLTVDGTGYTYGQTYNSDGRLATVSYPSGFTAKMLYNSTGYQCAVGDNAGSPTCATPTSTIWTLGSANADLNILTQTLGNGVAETDTYNANTGLLTNVRAGPSNAVAQFDYTWDTIGNLTYRADDLHAVYEKYCYDGLNRLTASATAATTPSLCTSTGTGITAKSVTYDAIGDILTKSDVGTYSYPASGASSVRPHAVSSIAGTVNGVTNPSYTYDGNGNMTAGAGRSVTPTSYNMAGSITQGSTTIAFTYDDGHSRIKQCVGSSCSTAAIYYLDDPASGASSEKVVTGSTVTWHDFVAAGGAVKAERFCTGAAPCASGATWNYVTSDHLGSTAVLTNGSGTVIESDSYDAWGKRRNIDGTDSASCSITSATDAGYTGHEMMDSICEINANARIYDPTIARFLSADTMVPNAADMQSYNRFAYVSNNPLNATDPTGHDGDAVCKPNVGAGDTKGGGDAPGQACGVPPAPGPNPAPGPSGSGGSSSGPSNVETVVVWGTAPSDDGGATSIPPTAPLTGLTPAQPNFVYPQGQGRNDGGGKIGLPQPPKPPAKPPKPKNCSVETRIAGGLEAADGTLNAGTLAGVGVAMLAAGGSAVAVGCGEPTPAEPLTCGLGVFAGSVALAGSGVAFTFSGVVVKYEVIPGVNKALSCTSEGG